MLFSKKTNKRTVTSKEHKYAVDPNLIGQDNYGTITVVRVEHRPFYDSRWAVITPHFQTVITRGENETAESLMDVILCLPVFTENIIKTLDQHDQIYYD